MIIRILTGIVIGGLAGFLLGYFGKCTSGTCPLTNNLWISTILGIIIGLMMALSR